MLVFPIDSDAKFAALQSRVHEVWARLLSSSLEDRLRYAPSDCFETFPFPVEAKFSALDSLGAKLDAERCAYMTANEVGLTTTYNRLKDDSVTDPAIVALRALHEQVDRAVLDAYGWSDIEVPSYCGATPAHLEAFEVLRGALDEGRVIRLVDGPARGPSSTTAAPHRAWRGPATPDDERLRSR